MEELIQGERQLCTCTGSNRKYVFPSYSHKLTSNSYALRTNTSILPTQFPLMTSDQFLIASSVTPLQTLKEPSNEADNHDEYQDQDQDQDHDHDRTETSPLLAFICLVNIVLILIIIVTLVRILTLILVLLILFRLLGILYEKYDREEE